MRISSIANALNSCYNWTLVELKYNILSGNFSGYLRYNWTLVELKYGLVEKWQRELEL